MRPVQQGSLPGAQKPALCVQDSTVPAPALTACPTAACELTRPPLHQCCLPVCQARVRVTQHGLGLQGRAVPPAGTSPHPKLPWPECERRGTTIRQCRQSHSGTLARSGLTGAPASSLQCLQFCDLWCPDALKFPVISSEVLWKASTPPHMQAQARRLWQGAASWMQLSRLLPARQSVPSGALQRHSSVWLLSRACLLLKLQFRQLLLAAQ